MAVAERLHLDDRAVRRIQRLDTRYGPGPLLLNIPFRPLALILAPGHLHTALRNTPEPFATAESTKRAALAHFEPRNVLVSHGSERAARRQVHEQALDTSHSIHRFAARYITCVEEEATKLLAGSLDVGQMDWDGFAAAWFRIVRRVIFGDQAREDRELLRQLHRLRRNANWAFLKPKREGLRSAFLAGVEARIAAAPHGSLAALARKASGPQLAPADQVAQWLFAFDGAGMAVFRALAVLATHPEPRRRARDEAGHAPSGAADLPYLRACILESVRLWPTTPMILRETTRAVEWEGTSLPEGCSVLVYVPYFHRDDRHVDCAHSFEPDLWLGAEAASGLPFVPFSEGPAACPGRPITLLLGSALLGRLMAGVDFAPRPDHGLRQGTPLPGTLNHFGLRFDVTPR